MKKYLISLFAIALSFSFLNAQPKIEIVGGDTYDWGIVSVKNDPLTTKMQVRMSAIKF